MSSITADSPLGQALQSRITPKLMELGWSSGEQDDTLSEYVILMLANGNDEQQIAHELSTDLLSSEPGDPAPAEFARWLFQQVQELQQGQNVQAAPAVAPEPSASSDTNVEGLNKEDADMGENIDPSAPIPTGPKAMRNGQKGAPRDKRLIGQMNKNMDRSTDVLHRVRGTAGTGRINSHSREPPKGPRGTNIARNLAATNGRGMVPQMPMGNQMPQMPYAGPGQQNGNGQLMLDAGQMQTMLHMLEQQAQMMTQMSKNMPGGFNGQGNNRGLGDRIQKGGRRFQPRQQHGQQAKAEGDTEMGDEGQSKDGEGNGERAKFDPATTECRWNRNCTNPDCGFGHTGPSTYAGLAVDNSAECPFALACKNVRCALRHPSPAKKTQYQASTACKFGPYCQNAACAFQHPNALPCKNGADCKEEGCTFWHNPVLCKFPQCTNKHCPYKHAEGQKRGFFKNKTVVFDGDGHVSERQFAQDGEEELIVPGGEGGGPAATSEGMDVIT